MTIPDPTPPPVQPVSPSANVLEYQYAQKAYKAFKVASGGLLIMASFLLLVGALVGIANFSSFFHLYSYTNSAIIFFILTAVLPVVWFVSYFLVAVLFQRRILWAGWTALIMSIVHFGLISCGLIMSIINWYQNSYAYQSYGSASYIAVIVVLVAAVAGFGAIIFEVWVAVRSPIVWLRADAPPPPPPSH